MGCDPTLIKINRELSLSEKCKSVSDPQIPLTLIHCEILPSIGASLRQHTHTHTRTAGLQQGPYISFWSHLRMAKNS